MSQCSVFPHSNLVILDGERIELPNKRWPFSHNVVTIDNRLFADGYEWIDGEWRITLASLWHLFF